MCVCEFIASFLGLCWACVWCRIILQDLAPTSTHPSVRQEIYQKHRRRGSIRFANARTNSHCYALVPTPQSHVLFLAHLFVQQSSRARGKRWARVEASTPARRRKEERRKSERVESKRNVRVHCIWKLLACLCVKCLRSRLWSRLTVLVSTATFWRPAQ